mgnify:CR=1 FL=1
MKEQVRLETMLLRRRKEPAGYNFVAPYQTDGKVLDKQVSVMWGDRNRKTVCLVRADVTDMLAQERRKKEELEAALALAEEASRAKSDFLSAMSHDIRTPLNAVIGMTELAFAHIGDRERVEDCLQTISLSSRHLLSLINNVLDMAKIERSSLVFNRMKIALPELVEQVSSIIALQAQNSGIRFSTDVNHIRHETIFGDPLRLNQILLNILGNAVKFTPDGGSVRLSLFYREETGLLDICVSDTGSGIPQQDIPYIFQRFFQSPHSGNKEGTGIGLYLVKTYTELHGGHINGVTSNEGKGTSIGLNIPVIAVEKEEIPATQVKKQLESLPVLKPIEAESQDEKFLSNIIRLIEDHLSESELNVNALCELSGISNKQIYRKIKQLTGMSPVEYIKSIRMKKAAMLLQQKKFTVAEVMYMVGFSNHSYFSKCFQAEFGKTPRQYLNEDL